MTAFSVARRQVAAALANVALCHYILSPASYRAHIFRLLHLLFHRLHASLYAPLFFPLCWFPQRVRRAHATRGTGRGITSNLLLSKSDAVVASAHHHLLRSRFISINHVFYGRKRRTRFRHRNKRDGGSLAKAAIQRVRGTYRTRVARTRSSANAFRRCVYALVGDATFPCAAVLLTDTCLAPLVLRTACSTTLAQPPGSHDHLLAIRLRVSYYPAEHAARPVQPTPALLSIMFCCTHTCASNALCRTLRTARFLQRACRAPNAARG